MGVMKEPGTGAYPDARPMRPSGLSGPQGHLTSINAQYMARVATPSRPMTNVEIADTIAAYARSVLNAKAVGCDGIALHGGHGYLLDTFLWAETNQRSDTWGGTLAQRTRYAVEVLKAVRAENGNELPISFRFSQWTQQDFRAQLGETPDALTEVLQPLDDAGVDLFEGSTRSFGQAEFPATGSSINLTGWAKKLTGKAAITVGGIGINKGVYDTMGDAQAAVTDLDPLMERFNADEFDLVGVGPRCYTTPPGHARLMRPRVSPSLAMTRWAF